MLQIIVIVATLITSGVWPQNGEALQSGTVEVGNLETGSVVGKPFKELVVDAELFVIVKDRVTTLYPPSIILDFKRGNRPLLFKVTNSTSSPATLYLSEDPAFTSKVALNVNVALKPGETKFIGIPTTILTNLTSGSTISFKSNPSSDRIEGQIIFIR